MSRRGRNSRAKKKKEEKKASQAQNQQQHYGPHGERLTKAEKKRLKKERRMAGVNGNEKKPVGFLRQVGNAVGDLYNGYGHGGYGYGTYKRVQEPTDGVEDTTLNLVLFSQKFLNGVAAQCVPVAGGSEFQTHYRSLQVIVSNEQGRIVFTIPTVFFNFPQKVSTGSVDYDLREVDKISAELKPKSDALAAQIAQVFPVAFFQEMGFEVKMREGEVGSIHRHPGDFSFSSIDLDKDPEKPGVIYRQGHATDLIQTDSVLYIQAQNHVKLVTTQTRVVDARLIEGGGIDGVYKRAKTIAMIHKDIETPDAVTNATPEMVFDQFFIPDGATEKEGLPEVLKNYLNRFDGITESEAETFIDKAAMVFQILISQNYQPINKLDPNLIESNTWAGKGSYGGYNHSTYKAPNTRTYKPGVGYVDATIDEPGKLDSKVVAEILNIDKEVHTVAAITEDEMRSFFWNCCGVANGTVGVELENGSITIEVITPKSNLMKVTLRTTLTSGVKNSMTKYINKQKAEDYYMEDEIELQELEDDDLPVIVEDDAVNLDGIDALATEQPEQPEADLVEEANDAPATKEEATEAALDEEANTTASDVVPEVVVDPNLTEDEKEAAADAATLKRLFLACYGKAFSELSLVNQFNDDALKAMLVRLRDIDTSKLYFKTTNVEVSCTKLNAAKQCSVTMKTKSSTFTRPINLA